MNILLKTLICLIFTALAIADKDEQKKEQQKSYPHRISFDLDNSQYKKLKWASFDSDRPMNDILREALEE